jgi:hypothetical protein
MMEESLVYWIDWMNSKQAKLSKALIQSKAVELVRSFEQQIGKLGATQFEASPGWFYRFCGRTGVRSIKCTGESALVDKNVISNFTQEFEQLIRVHNCTLQQVFNCDELGLFWKLTPNRTYAPGYVKFIANSKMDKKRISVLVGKKHAFNVAISLIHHPF